MEAPLKPPRTVFLLYKSRTLQSVVAQFSDLQVTGVLKVIADRWQAESAQFKAQLQAELDLATAQSMVQQMINADLFKKRVLRQRKIVKRPEPVEKKKPDSKRRDRPNRPNQTIRPNRPNQSDRPQRLNRANQSERPERPVQPDLPDHLDQQFRTDQPDPPQLQDVHIVPIRPQSSFFLYRQKTLQLVKIEFPALQLDEITQVIDHRWHAQSAEFKASLQKLVDDAMVQYKEQMEAYTQQLQQKSICVQQIDQNIKGLAKKMKCKADQLQYSAKQQMLSKQPYSALQLQVKKLFASITTISTIKQKRPKKKKRKR